jgi:tRNA pseudouridine32 synthase/23S rRNA pseudouridine746 synthase
MTAASSVPSPTHPGLAPDAQYAAQVGQAGLAVGEGAYRVSGASNALHSKPHQPNAAEQPNAPETSNTATRLTWLALEPLTGRTHQLRVHCAAMGWPIVGDSIYGNAPRSGGPPLHLHARAIVVPLYKHRDPIAVAAPVPPHMHGLLRACGWPGEAVD